MVVSLGPGKFYGSSLPRPRIYTDVKLNDDRVDPPPPVLDPLLSWAHEAHWSMGGLSFKRLRLQGRIEGNVQKLRTQREKIIKKRKQMDPSKDSVLPRFDNNKTNKNPRSSSVSPPPAPIASKRRRYMTLIDEEEEEEEEEEMKGVEIGVRRGLARKLGDDFDRVARESVRSQNADISEGSNGLGAVASRTRSKRAVEEDDGVDDLVEEVKKSGSDGKKLKGVKRGKSSGGEGASSVTGIRVSPRLMKRGLN